jgi:hypothetical protein
MLSSYIYHRPETNQDEPVQPWRWCWEAHYLDGAVLQQFNDTDATFHQIREIEMVNLHFLRAINYDTGQHFDILWHPSRKLVAGILHNLLENATIDVPIYYFGYVTQVNGTNHNVILAILPDDTVIVTEDLGRISF